MTTAITLFIGDGAWRIGLADKGTCRIITITAGDGVIPAARIDAVKAALTEAGCLHAPIILALPSATCLSASISTLELDRRERQRAMLFRLEEHLPVAAEDVVAAFVESLRGEALGVCTPSRPLVELVGSLESAGLRVGHVCPAAMLAAAWAAEKTPKPRAVWISSQTGASTTVIDLIELHDGQPLQWMWFADDRAAGHEELRTITMENPGEAIAVFCSGAVDEAAQLVQVAGFEVRNMEVNCDEASSLMSARIAQGSAAPWFDLRRDALAASRASHDHRPLAALMAAVAMLFIAISVVALWRGQQYERLADEQLQQQSSIFQSAMPGQRVPASIKARLLSERQRLTGLGGAASSGQGGESAQPSALAHLLVVLELLPTDLRFRIHDLSIAPEAIRIDGVALSHAEAEQIAVALRVSGLFEVEPPKTQSLGGRGVSFVFTAKRIAANAGAQTSLKEGTR